MVLRALSLKSISRFLAWAHPAAARPGWGWGQTVCSNLDSRWVERELWIWEREKEIQTEDEAVWLGVYELLAKTSDLEAKINQRRKTRSTRKAGCSLQSPPDHVSAAAGSPSHVAENEGDHGIHMISTHSIPETFKRIT